MNQIYNKNKPKRKYVRKPLCNNVIGLCTGEKCRCDMAIKVPNTKQKVDNNFLHRQKVVKRRREIDLNKLDEENLHSDMADALVYSFKVQGLKPKKKKVKWFNILLKVMFWGLITLIIYLLLINLLEIVLVIRDDKNKLVAIVESDMIKRSQIFHSTEEMGIDEVKDLLENSYKI